MFSRFKNKEKHFYAWKHGDARNQNVNKFAVRISVISADYSASLSSVHDNA